MSLECAGRARDPAKVEDQVRFLARTLSASEKRVLHQFVAVARNDRKIEDRNIEEACVRIGPPFFIFLSSIFLSFLQRNAQTGDVVAVETPHIRQAEADCGKLRVAFKTIPVQNQRMWPIGAKSNGGSPPAT